MSRPRNAIDIPPPRYRVIEKGRRLEVVDTRTGHAAIPPRRAVGPDRTPAMAGTRSGRGSRWPVTHDSRGRTVIATQRWWDARGPRRLIVSGAQEDLVRSIGAIAAVAGMALVFVAVTMPVLLAPLALVAVSDKFRAGIREAIAGYLDDMDQDAGADSRAG